ncbi:MAG: hypothetical protein DWQ05_09975 [Calditrichaeota bacterium]|nr:MAG: hypothetical protein DWQ05_09975 [Calditrichota bacterium]
MKAHLIVSTKSIALFVLYIFFIPGIVPLGAQINVETLQITGKVNDFSSNIVSVDGKSFYIRANSRVYSQAYSKLPLKMITINSLVDISYYKIGKLFIIDKMKLLDMVGSGNYKIFTGKIKKTGKRGVQIGNKNFLLDDFTIKIGLKLQKTDIAYWRNSYVTITALKNEAGNWIAEIIREGITPSPALTTRLAE